MDVSIIIVSWNTRDLLYTCLTSVYAYTRGVSFEIFVIDNASSDGTPSMIGEHFPQVQLIANASNLGFASANNQGIRAAKGIYILLLNPDTEFLQDSISVLFKFMETHKRCGIGGPHLLNPDGSH